MLRHKRSHHNEKPSHHNWRKPVHSNEDPVQPKTEKENQVHLPPKLSLPSSPCSCLCRCLDWGSRHTYSICWTWPSPLPSPTQGRDVSAHLRSRSSTVYEVVVGIGHPEGGHSTVGRSRDGAASDGGPLAPVLPSGVEGCPRSRALVKLQGTS